MDAVGRNVMENIAEVGGLIKFVRFGFDVWRY